MRAIWNGVVSFGLVSVAVRLYAATYNHDIRFHQVHDVDGGRIRYKRVCEVCGNEVEYVDLAKGYQTEDGELVTLDSDDMASLPLSTSREIEVVEFVPAEQVDPLLLDRSYYLEPDPKALKPYVLLREALRKADQMAVVKIALRQRETLALLRVRDKMIVLQTMLWPDEVRTPDFPILDDEVRLRDQELQMASVLVDSLRGEFDPNQFDDQYRKAVEELIDYKRTHGGARPVPAAATATGEPIGDLLTALKRSVEEARAARGGAAPNPAAPSPAAPPAARGGRKKPAPAGQQAEASKAPKTASTPKAAKAPAKPATRKAAAQEPGTRKPPAAAKAATNVAKAGANAPTNSEVTPGKKAGRSKRGA